MRVSANEVRGIWTILYAFFDRAERLDRGLMRRQVEACVACRPAGIACLGLATEVGKLDFGERRQVVEWLAEDLAGRLPFAVTIAGNTVAEQVAAVGHAAAAGASLVILQPPAVPGLPEREYLRFFGRVADASTVAVAIQNAAAYLGMALTVDGLVALHRQHPNLTLLKAEAPAIEVAELIERTGGAFRVLNGRAGLELVDNLRAGCVGIVPAPDVADLQVAAHAAYLTGDEAAAEALYARTAPAIAFVMQSIPMLLAYGKRLAALRMGLAPADVHDRAPALTPTPAGLAAVVRFAATLGAFPKLQA